MIRVRTPVQHQRIPLVPASAAPVEGGTELARPLDSFQRRVMRSKKPLFVTKRTEGSIDQAVVSPVFYNSFNYTLEGQNLEGTAISVGVTSPNPGDGKTLVAANLAVSLALSTERQTVLVDFHTAQPKLHSIFGVPQGPGLLESLTGESIDLWDTGVPRLHFLSAGTARTPHKGIAPKANTEGLPPARNHLSLRLDDLGAFRDVLVSLKDVFEFIVLDLPSLRGNALPTVFTSEIDQFIVVVLKEHTKTYDLDALIRRIDPERVLGFVVNQQDLPSKKWRFR